MTSADRALIAQLIPHQGAMSLLDQIVSWDESNIVATAATHRSTEHPLRDHGRLRAVHLCEYGAQAAALHGGLIARAAGARAAPAIWCRCAVSASRASVSMTWRVICRSVPNCCCSTVTAGNIHSAPRTPETRLPVAAWPLSAANEHTDPLRTGRAGAAWLRRLRPDFKIRGARVPAGHRRACVSVRQFRLEYAQKGAVTDSLNVGLGSLRTGIFNVADAILMLGVAVLLISLRARS